MLFIVNLKSFSQAGRRGFESRLPLQEISPWRHRFQPVLRLHDQSSFRLVNDRLPPFDWRLRIHALIDIQRVSSPPHCSFCLQIPAKVVHHHAKRKADSAPIASEPPQSISPEFSHPAQVSGVQSRLRDQPAWLFGRIGV